YFLTPFQRSQGASSCGSRGWLRYAFLREWGQRLRIGCGSIWLGQLDGQQQPVAGRGAVVQGGDIALHFQARRRERRPATALQQVSHDVGDRLCLIRWNYQRELAALAAGLALLGEEQGADGAL